MRPMLNLLEFSIAKLLRHKFNGSLSDSAKNVLDLEIFWQLVGIGGASESQVLSRRVGSVLTASDTPEIEE